MTLGTRQAKPIHWLSSLALGSVIGCNAVLGIERAELEETSAIEQECRWPPARPSADCAPCEEGCTGRCDVSACLSNKECRKGLLDYRRCTGDACTDGTDSCKGCFAASPQAAELSQCLEGCGTGCGASGAASLCESYCSCMQAQCDSNLPGGSYGTCLTACMTGSTAIDDPFAAFGTAPAAWEVTCFWEHCERASQNDGFHCLHAIGDNKAANCQPPAPPSANDPLCEYPKGYGNAPCNTDADCCFICRSDVGVCSAN